MLLSENRRFPQLKSRRKQPKNATLVRQRAERSLHENRAYQAEKNTDIWFDEKEPLIYIRTHNTDLKNRLTAYAAAHPGECRQSDADPDTGCIEFEICKGRFSFRLTAPYSDERRQAASELAKKNGLRGRV